MKNIPPKNCSKNKKKGYATLEAKNANPKIYKIQQKLKYDLFVTGSSMHSKSAGAKGSLLARIEVKIIIF